MLSYSLRPNIVVLEQGRIARANRFVHVNDYFASDFNGVAVIQIEGATSFSLRALEMRLIKFENRYIVTFCVLLREMNFSTSSQLVEWLRTMRNICCLFPTGFPLDSHTSDVVTVAKEVWKRPIRRTVTAV